MRPDGDLLLTVREIAAFRPELLRLARGRRWAGDVEDMVQETLAWACAERDSYNPAKGTVGAWLWGMLLTVSREYVDRWRTENPKIPDGVRKSTIKYAWPKNLSQSMLEVIARPCELRAVRAKTAGQSSPYQTSRLADLRKKVSEYAPLWKSVTMRVERREVCVPLDAICEALRGTVWRIARRR